MVRKQIILFSSFMAMVLMIGCAEKKPFHGDPLPDPKSFNAHFDDMDADGNDGVEWEEFKKFFSHARPEVFRALDLDADGVVDHDEWHEFKKAHGLKHVD